jgi:hypothetical protein
LQDDVDDEREYLHVGIKYEFPSFGGSIPALNKTGGHLDRLFDHRCYKRITGSFK